MRRMLSVLSLLFSVALVGCVTLPTPTPLTNIAYSGTVTASSSKSVEVVILTGQISGSSSSTLIPTGKTFASISLGTYPDLQFTARDQREFGVSLSHELVRLGLFKVALDPLTERRADVRINVLFALTDHSSGFQQYSLLVAMEITDGVAPVVKEYRIVSNEKDSLWEKMNTNAFQGKAKAVKLLLERVIPDIETFIASRGLDADLPLLSPPAL